MLLLSLAVTNLVCRHLWFYSMSSLGVMAGCCGYFYSAHPQLLDAASFVIVYNSVSLSKQTKKQNREALGWSFLNRDRTFVLGKSQLGGPLMWCLMSLLSQLQLLFENLQVELKGMCMSWYKFKVMISLWASFWSCICSALNFAFLHELLKKSAQTI